MENQASLLSGSGKMAEANNAKTAPAPQPQTPAGGGRVNHTEQLEQLRRVLPEPPNGVELVARAQILEHTMNVIENLMQRATFLAVELAVASPEATRRWVRACSSCGQKPFIHTVGSVMKLFAMRKNWRYAEWWTLDERKVDTKVAKRETHKNNKNNNKTANTTVATTIATNADHDTATTPAADETDGDQVDKPVGVMEDPGNVHGCVVRDSESVMRLAWTLINRNSSNSEDNSVLNTYAAGNAAELHQSANEMLQRGGGGGGGGGGGSENENDESNKDDQNNEDVRNMIEFARESQRFEFRPRVGMPGRVWTSRRAEWLTNLKDSEVFARSPLAEKFGMETCLAVPIQFGGHVHSIMAFFAQEARPYDSDSYDLACTLARCVEEVYSPNRASPWITGADSRY